MIKRKWIRLTLGVILGGFAGLSLTTSILPVTMSTIGMADSFIIRWMLSGYAAHTAIAWAVGGWLVVKIDNPKIGATLLGLIGVVSGVLLTLLALDSRTSTLIAGGVAGGAYGTIGGLLIGTVLRGGDDQSATIEKDR